MRFREQERMINCMEVLLPPIPNVPCVVRQCYLTALMLSGSRRRAERALFEAIELLEPQQIGGDALLTITIQTVLAMGEHGEAQLRGELPEELAAVAELPQLEKRCYVLRILASWSARACAETLGMSERRVDEMASQAATCLAGLHQLATI